MKEDLSINESGEKIKGLRDFSSYKLFLNKEISMAGRIFSFNTRQINNIYLPIVRSNFIGSFTRYSFSVSKKVDHFKDSHHFANSTYMTEFSFPFEAIDLRKQNPEPTQVKQAGAREKLFYEQKRMETLRLTLLIG